ncbi:hypothetical protein HK57_00428 [Aspergillus ustus]|uniref:Uncharacterized protein n=1 Tax=Aspergillus ustus TaxID=40382 RepID=A0A0C1EGN5_ASPUT|nr:hypothetical protein HK57_00428 [Aspergillus ustus]
MSVGEEEKRKQERLQSLLSEYRVHFVRLSHDNIPQNLRHEFELVRKIDQVSFHRYSRSESGETDPTILQNNIARARALLTNVESCSEYEVIEAQWREKVERRLFSILERPMICEIPAPDHIFKYLVQTRVQYEPELRKRLPKGKEPDLVLGLVNGRRFRKILATPPKSQASGEGEGEQTVADVVKSDLFASTSGIIFPFLVLEAKQGRARDSSRDIERQMAFPAYEMLRMQTCLMKLSGLADRRKRLPRVWLISAKAEIWKFYTGTATEREDGEYDYNIHHMWTGDISTEIGALKLVLLLDGILDWARDIYRMTIFEHLSSISSAPEDLQEFSRMTMTPIAEAIEELVDSTANLQSMPAIPESPGRVRKYTSGWVVDARYVTLSGGGLLITGNNIRNLFGALKRQDKAKSFARKICKAFSKTSFYSPNGEFIDKVRDTWVQDAVARQAGPDSPIYLQIATHRFIDRFYELNFALTFVAITEDSIAKLFEYAKYSSTSGLDEGDVRQAGHLINEDKLLRAIRAHRSGGLNDDTIKKCVSRIRTVARSSSPVGSRAFFKPISLSRSSFVDNFQYILSIYPRSQRQHSKNFLNLWKPSKLENVTTDERDRDQVLVIADSLATDWNDREGEDVTPPLGLFVFQDIASINECDIKKVLKRELREHSHYHTYLKGKSFYDTRELDDLGFFRRSQLFLDSNEGRFIVRRDPVELLESWIKELPDSDGSADETSSSEYQGQQSSDEEHGSSTGYSDGDEDVKAESDSERDSGEIPAGVAAVASNPTVLGSQDAQTTKIARPVFRKEHWTPRKQKLNSNWRSLVRSIKPEPEGGPPQIHVMADKALQETVQQSDILLSCPLSWQADVVADPKASTSQPDAHVTFGSDLVVSEETMELIARALQSEGHRDRPAKCQQ